MGYIVKNKIPRPIRILLLILLSPYLLFDAYFIMKEASTDDLIRWMGEADNLLASGYKRTLSDRIYEIVWTWQLNRRLK